SRMGGSISNAHASKVNSLVRTSVVCTCHVCGFERTRQATHMRNPIEGKEIYRQYCASCHGVDGRGHGPAAVALRHRAPDLTTISRKHGGTFPFQQVKDIDRRETKWPLSTRQQRNAGLGANLP